MAPAPSLLLVDDRPQNLLALEAILEPLGYELVTAGSAAEALRILLNRDDFAVILLDVQMPGMDGFEAAEVIKQRERTSTIPIIFLTALSKEDQHVFRGYEVGAVDYVFKPFNPEILRAKVARLRRAVGEEPADPRPGRPPCGAGARRASPRERGAVSPARGRDAADRLDRRRGGTRHLLQPPLVRVHRHDRGRARRSRLGARHASGRPAAGGRPPRGDARERRHLRGRVPLQVPRRDLALAPRPGGADPPRGRVDRLLDRHRDGHRRPQAHRGGAALPARRRRRALPLARLARRAEGGCTRGCSACGRLVRCARRRGGRHDLVARDRACGSREGDLRPRGAGALPAAPRQPARSGRGDSQRRRRS